MADTGESGEVLLDFKVLVDSLVGKSVVLGLVGFHLHNVVDEVLGL